MSTRGRYFSPRDLRLVASFNAELMGNIVETLIQIFKISPMETKSNIYGEASAETGKWYLPGIQISASVEKNEMTTGMDDFGPSRDQTHLFHLRYAMCKQLNFFPEVGDIISWNYKFYEVNNVVDDLQLLGGQPDKNHSITCNAQYTRVSSLNIVERNPS